LANLRPPLRAAVLVGLEEAQHERVELVRLELASLSLAGPQRACLFRRPACRRRVPLRALSTSPKTVRPHPICAAPAAAARVSLNHWLSCREAGGTECVAPASEGSRTVS
jgi:hypothetical protein